MAAVQLNLAILHGLPLERQRFEQGERIFLQDDPATHMYVVTSGKVQVITFGAVLENVGPGGMFGEMAMIDDGPRSAAAMAAEATEVIAIDQPMFHLLVQDYSEFSLAVMRVLAQRIRRMNESV